MRKALKLIILSLLPLSVFGESWKPDPKFSIEGSTYIETLTFISGVSYGLTYAANELRRQEKLNFYCYNKGKVISSRLLIDLVNERLSGDHTSEQVISVITEQLKNKFPCP